MAAYRRSGASCRGPSSSCPRTTARRRDRRAESRGAADAAIPRKLAKGSPTAAEPIQTTQRPSARRATARPAETATRAGRRRDRPRPTTSRLPASRMKAAYRAEFIVSGAWARRVRPSAFLPRASPGESPPLTGVRESTFSATNTVSRPKTGYNLHMLLAIFAMRVLEVMFFVGLAGSTVVVLISFFEDGKELFGKDEPPQPRA